MKQVQQYTTLLKYRKHTSTFSVFLIPYLEQKILILMHHIDMILYVKSLIHNRYFKYCMLSCDFCFVLFWGFFVSSFMFFGISVSNNLTVHDGNLYHDFHNKLEIRKHEKRIRHKCRPMTNYIPL